MIVIHTRGDLPKKYMERVPMMVNKISINISKNIFEEIQRRVKENTEFNNVEDYVEFVLSEVLKEDPEETFTEEEENKIKDRLKRLGYIE